MGTRHRFRSTSTTSTARGAGKRSAVGTGPAQKVPLLDLEAQYADLEPEIMDAIRRVCQGQRFILGPHVAQLEDRIAQYCQCRYAIGVSSGTDALLAALMSLGVGPGDAVVTSPYSFFATAGVIHRLSARPLFCDIDPQTFNVCPRAVADFLADRCRLEDGQLVHRASGARVKVLMPVHLFGQTADMRPLLELTKRYGLRLVEDAAQAIGARDEDGRRAGSMGDIGCFSFFPSKNLGAFGDAGMCTTNYPELAERLSTLRVHGARSRHHHTVVGGNFRLDELQAAVLLVKLGHLDRWTEARRRNACLYEEALRARGLGGKLETPRAVPGSFHVFNQFVVRARQREGLAAWLGESGIGTAVYYPLSLHRQQCFARLGYQAEDFPEANRAAAESLALPVYPELSASQLAYVVDRIAAFYEMAHEGGGR